MRWTPAHAWVCDQTRACLWALNAPRRVGKTVARRRLVALGVLALALARADRRAAKAALFPYLYGQQGAVPAWALVALGQIPPNSV